MSEPIDETLKKIAKDTPTGKIDPSQINRRYQLPGDPDCPICKGVGYLRQDVPVGDPDFGRLQVCACRKGRLDQRRHQRLFAMSNLDELRHLTFETFQSRGRVGLRAAQAESLEMAFNQSQIFSRTQKGWLLLSGTYGCGKTHLAAAIANFAVEMGIATLFITVPDLLDTLRFAYDDPEATFEQRFEEIRSVPLLIMDDFGTQNATSWAQEKLFQIINYRYIKKLPLVVTTNLMLESIEPRIRSRLDDPELVTPVKILAPDYRRPAYDSLGSTLDTYHKYTFANFDLRTDDEMSSTDLDSLKRAFDAARQYAEKPRGWLVLTGPTSCGKTHLAAAIANYRADLGQLPVIWEVTDLFDYLRATFGPQSTISLDRRFEEVKNASLLILDNLSTRNMSHWVREKVHQLFNYRYLSELPTVITTPEHKDEMDARILSRIQDTRLSTIIGITAPPYRGNRPAKRKTSRR